MDLGDRVYRLGLHLLPADVRRAFGDDITQLFRDRRREARGHPWATLRLWAAASSDLLIEAVAARRKRHDHSSPAERARVMAWPATLVQDLRFGLRLLARDWGFTSIALLVLAIGIGANAAAFGFVNALLLKPRPGHPAGAVVGVYDQNIAPPASTTGGGSPRASAPGSFRAFSYPEFLQLRERHDVFQSLAAHNFAFVGLTEHDETRQVIADMVTHEFFDVFGAPLVIGRPFTPEEERPGSGAAVAILSFDAWQRRGGHPDILGTTLRLNGQPVTVVGVAPRGFGGSLAFISPELWVPISAYDRLANDFVREGTSTLLADRRTRMLVLDAQLRPGLTMAGAAPALAQMTAALAAADRAAAPQRLVVAPLARMGVSTSPDTDGDLAPLTMALLVLAGLVLLIASLNLANMLLARGVARRKEFAVRLAIGGGRGRLLRQLLTEGALLAGFGAVLGLLAATWSTSALAAGLAPYLPVSFTLDLVPDWRVLAATMVFTTVSVLLSSVGPAWALTRRDVVADLKTQGREWSERSRIGARQLLVTTQLALSLVIVTAAGLFVRSATEAAAANPGFDLDHGVVIQLDASLAGLTPIAMQDDYARMLDALRARPDVVSASLASNMPYSGFSDQRTIQRAGARLPDDDPRRVSSELVSIASDYFKSLGLRLHAGHEFTAAAETAGSTSGHQAIIDASLAARLFGHEPAIGRSIQYDPLAAGLAPVLFEVVGVAPNVAGELFDSAPVPHVYVPYSSDPRGSIYVHVNTRTPAGGSDAALLPGLRAAIARVDARVPLLSIGTRATYRDHGIILALIRTGARVFAIFGLAALVLAAAGVYGVKAFLVSRRTREIGIRIALGATRGRIVWLVAREGLTVALVGLGLGALLSFVVASGLRSMTYQQHGIDPRMLATTAGVLLATALVAGAIPARRATRIEPSATLKG